MRVAARFTVVVFPEVGVPVETTIGERGSNILQSIFAAFEKRIGEFSVVL